MRLHGLLLLLSIAALFPAERAAHAAPCRSDADCTMCRGCCGQQNVYRKGGPLPSRCQAGIQCSCTAPPAGGYAKPKPTCRKGRCVAVYFTRVSISAAECKKKGLPPVTLALSVSASAGLTIHRLRNKRAYVEISGPPGGPLGLRVAVSKTAGKGLRALRALAREQVRTKPLALARRSTTVRLGKKRYKALGYTCGTSLAREAGCVVLIAARRKKTPGVALRFWGPAPPKRTNKRTNKRTHKRKRAATCAALLRGRWSALARDFSLRQ